MLFRQSEMIFKKVAVSERKLLFRELAQVRLQVTIKGAQDQIFHLLAVQNEKDEKLLCHHTEDSKGISENQKILLNFEFNNERYYMQTELAFEVGWAVVTINNDLFQLQRRANARFNIPEEYNARFVLNAHAGKKVLVDSVVKDISAGGMKLEVQGSTLEFNLGEILKGSLRLGQRRPIEFEVEIRFAQKKEKVYVIGVQFLNINTLMENRLLSLMMDLQREFYLKYSKK